MPTPDIYDLNAQFASLTTAMQLHTQYVKEALARIESKVDENTHLTADTHSAMESRVKSIEKDLEWTRKLSTGVFVVGSGLAIAFLKTILHLP